MRCCVARNGSGGARHAIGIHVDILEQLGIAAADAADLVEAEIERRAQIARVPFAGVARAGSRHRAAAASRAPHPGSCRDAPTAANAPGCTRRCASGKRRRAAWRAPGSRRPRAYSCARTAFPGWPAGRYSACGSGERPAMVAHCCWSVMMCRMLGRAGCAGVCAAAAARPAGARQKAPAIECVGHDASPLHHPCDPACKLDILLAIQCIPNSISRIAASLCAPRSPLPRPTAESSAPTIAFASAPSAPEAAASTCSSQLKLAEQNEIVACCDVYQPRRLEAKSEVRHRGRHRLRRLSRDSRPQGYRRRRGRHARSLARSRHHRQRPRRQGRLLREARHPHAGGGRPADRRRARDQTNRADRHAAAQLGALRAGARRDPRRTPRPGHADPHLLVPESHSRQRTRAQLRHLEARLEALPGRGARPAVRPRPVRQLALVLGFRRRRHDRPLRPLGGCRALDHGHRQSVARHGERV